MLRWGWFALAYGALSALAVALALGWAQTSPLLHPEPWLQLDGTLSHLYSLLLGLAFGSLVVLLTRVSVTRFGWAQRLHRELQPIARTISPLGVLVLAGLSSCGEELFFRGLLQPQIGLLPQALLFGVLHQIPGPSRWVWVSWAAAVGLFFGAIFQLTGSLLGPFAAHALINGMNLHYLRNRDLGGGGRTLGGLLGQRS
jgi:membrane protease YdiL (CAAX protease family)